MSDTFVLNHDATFARGLIHEPADMLIDDKAQIIATVGFFYVFKSYDYESTFDKTQKRFGSLLLLQIQY